MLGWKIAGEYAIMFSRTKIGVHALLLLALGAQVALAQQRQKVIFDQDCRGHRILEDAGMLRFAAVSDRDYDPIREMARVAEL